MDRFVAQKNVERFARQIANEADPAKRASLRQLLEEALAELKAAEEAHKRAGD